MRPFIHHIYELADGEPGKQITTIPGKANFKRWVMRRYFEEAGSAVCFRLEVEGTYYEVIPFVYLKGRNKGKDRVVFARLGPVSESVSDVPF